MCDLSPIKALTSCMEKSILPYRVKSFSFNESEVFVNGLYSGKIISKEQEGNNLILKYTVETENKYLNGIITRAVISGFYK